MRPGDSAEFEHTVTQSDIARFAELSGDTNPLHTDAAYAAETPFGKPIAHGMFLGALVSRLLGVYLPGKNCLYLSQTLEFHKPVYTGETVMVSGVVTHTSESTKISEIAIQIKKGETVCVKGIAKVTTL